MVLIVVHFFSGSTRPELQKRKSDVGGAEGRWSTASKQTNDTQRITRQFKEQITKSGISTLIIRHLRTDL